MRMCISKGIGECVSVCAVRPWSCLSAERVGGGERM